MRASEPVATAATVRGRVGHAMEGEGVRLHDVYLVATHTAHRISIAIMAAVGAATVAFFRIMAHCCRVECKVAAAPSGRQVDGKG